MLQIQFNQQMPFLDIRLPRNSTRTSRGSGRSLSGRKVKKDNSYSKRAHRNSRHSILFHIQRKKINHYRKCNVQLHQRNEFVHRMNIQLLQTLERYHKDYKELRQTNEEMRERYALCLNDSNKLFEICSKLKQENIELRDASFYLNQANRGVEDVNKYLCQKNEHHLKEIEELQQKNTKLNNRNTEIHKGLANLFHANKQLREEAEFLNSIISDYKTLINEGIGQREKNSKEIFFYLITTWFFFLVAIILLINR